MWHQSVLTLRRRPRGMHLITSEIEGELGEQLRRTRVGLLHLFLQHTSASISINENCDPDVRKDLETVMNRVVPEEGPYLHTDEGPDDMPAHAKSSLIGCSLSIPVRDGSLALGTWQGIYLCEHRDHASQRRIVLTLNGCTASS
eukprot:TRINITY_DN927_c0_g1_i1.p2 TRINITY_DN927_c0_g1~~TRINITY_DN927_c0_g1_i1.p2  ORF type:complete len:144 (+),score=38.60 TRINITY_DN927_c0_g1_i1:355-786(+)